MLQISQTEKPICSATIDQMRLRRATNLPVVSQNFGSSGFQSEIQDVCMRMSLFLSGRSAAVGRSRKRCAKLIALKNRRFSLCSAEICAAGGRQGHESANA